MSNKAKWPSRRAKLSMAIALTSLPAVSIYAQQAPPQIEEIVVQGRLRDAASSILGERMEQPFSAEIIGIEQISRAGDSDVAMALRRVTGLSLVDGKYIYVRGLGERYSSATLNGAEIPSPELSRNVIPLDFIPASILETVKVSKAYSADQPAAFGGGNVDIRTRGAPDELVFDISLGSGWNTENSDDGLRIIGDGGGLPNAIQNGINTYQGNVSPSNIAEFEFGPVTPTEEQRLIAQQINNDMLLALDRDINIEDEGSIDPDMNGSITVGNVFDLNDDFSLSALAYGGYSESWRNSNQFEQSWTNPEENFRDIQRTFYTESLTAAFNLALTFQNDHRVETNSYLLQDDEDQSSIVRGFNPDFLPDSGRQRRVNVSRLEKRELWVNQVVGEHTFFLDDLDFLPLPEILDPITSVDVNWFYSDAEVTTEIPNSSSANSTSNIDPNTRELFSTGVNVGNTVQFAFLDLEDNVESWGYSFDANYDLDGVYGTVSGGWNYSEKSREYLGYTANVVFGALGREGFPWETVTDRRLSDLDNEIFLDMGANFGTESYIAGETKTAMFGAIDSYFGENWRFSAGVRYEDFHRGVIPLNLLDFSGDFLSDVIDEISGPNQTAAIVEDDYYPSAALTYIRDDGIFNTESFQVRFGYGETVVRPDLREFADIQYIDPVLNDRVQGNPNLIFSNIEHYDLRTEFFFDDGDNLTISLFYKDIQAPIERVELPGPADERLLSFENAESGEVYGIEVETLQYLGAGFFASGNVVVSDSELKFDSSSSQTNLTRRLTGHSEYVVNAQLGYDSEDGRHAVSLLYNVFGERVFFGGRQQTPDAFEEPFNSLDLTYSFFATDNLTLKLRAQNILNENREFEQGGVKTIDVETGARLRLDLQWQI